MARQRIQGNTQRAVTAVRTVQRNSEGGPREGGGGAVARAPGVTEATGQDRRAPSGSGCVAVGGNTRPNAPMHSGQSSVWVLAGVSVASPATTTSFMLPLVAHTKSVTWGLTMGAAMATPSDKANQTNTQRVRW